MRCVRFLRTDDQLIIWTQMKEGDVYGSKGRPKNDYLAMICRGVLEGRHEEGAREGYRDLGDFYSLQSPCSTRFLEFEPRRSIWSGEDATIHVCVLKLDRETLALAGIPRADEILEAEPGFVYEWFTPGKIDRATRRMMEPGEELVDEVTFREGPGLEELKNL